MDGKQCSKNKIGLQQCDCTGIDDPSFPIMKLRMGHEYDQHWFEMGPKDYLFTIQDQCVI